MRKFFPVRKAVSHALHIPLFFHCCLVLLFTHAAQAQQNNRSNAASWVLYGNVTNEKGEAMPGVNVKTVKTPRTTTTNLNGNFMIEIDGNNELLSLSFVGYKTQELPAGTARQIDIRMQPDSAGQKLNEVIVVGYGTQKKISVTGAISSISVKELQQTATPSLSNALGGRLPGIITRQSAGEPGYDQAQLLIRGIGTSGNSAPLVLVDGVERSMDNLTTQEIESFTILKDASATAVYGVRGANGVILINTKRGRIGKPAITFRTETADLKGLRFPDFIDGPSYAKLVNESYVNVGQAAPYTQDDLQKYQDGSDPFFHPNVNWTNQVLKKHTIQSINNLSVSGGNEVVRYFTNVGYTVQGGLWKEDPHNPYKTNAMLKRYNFRSNTDINLSKNFTIDLGLGGIIQSSNYPGTPARDIFGAITQISPIQYPVTNPDGSPAGGLSYLGGNPWALVTQSGYVHQENNTLQGTFGAKWDLSSLVTKGLSIRGRFSFDYFHYVEDARRKQYAIKQYLGKDPVTGADKYNVIREEQPLGYGVSNSTNRAIYKELSLNYDRTFGSHSIGGLLLGNQREYLDLNAPNSTAALPYRRQGLAGRATYDYNKKYLLEFDFGYNGSENFPKGKRYGFFPSISGGWIVSNEKFWNVGFINSLKLRGSYGKVGNDQIGGARFLFLTTVNTNTNQYFFGTSQQSYPGYDEGQIGNQNVTWEVATKKNIGLDVEMFNGKLVLQMNAFDERRTGILMQRQTVPVVTGFFPWIIPYGNLGKVNNKGLDAMLEIKHSGANGLYYSFRANFTYAHNTVVENDEPVQKYAYQSGKGHSIDAPFGLQATGFFKDQDDINRSTPQSYVSVLRPGDTKYKDVNGDGVIDDYDRVYLHGYPRIPEIMYGFGGTVAYKGFDITAYFTGAAHTSFFFSGPSMYPFQRGPATYNILHEYYDNRWTATHQDARYPAVTNGDNANNFRSSTVYMRDASYLRLKNAEIGYTLPRKLTDRCKITALRFFINGTNLVTIDKLKVIDPEANNGTGGYPLQRALNFGAQINFN